MQSQEKYIPRVGVVVLAFQGYFLGEETAHSKYKEVVSLLSTYKLDVVSTEEVIMNENDAMRIGEKFNDEKIDLICVLLATFVPDHYIVKLLDKCDVPIFIWALEREINCIALVGAMLANPTLYELEKHYVIHAGDTCDVSIKNEIMIFARASMILRILHNMRVGYLGENPNIMMSLVADEYGLKKIFGIDIVPLRDFEFSDKVKTISDREALSDWNLVKKKVGSVEVADKDGINSSKLYLAILDIVREKRLDAISINCWTQLKSKVCLPIARLNDLGISAGCEGDLHSTILMRLLDLLGSGSVINGDFLRMFPDENQILFSHCGAGSFSMATSVNDIVLHNSIETNDGIGVFFPVNKLGIVTACNLMGSRAGYRLAIMVGDVKETDMVYEGNPMRVQFKKPVYEIFQSAVRYGAGHHWSIVYGDFSRELELLSKFLNVDFVKLS